MRRIKLTIEYNGKPYHGFQRQEGLPTVQGKLETALEKITHHAVNICVCGRTDRGVHAKGQVVHFDTESPHPLIKFKDGTNHHTPDDIQIIKAEEVTDDFHARFAATTRHYQFLVFNRWYPSPFHADFSTHVSYELDIKKMQKAVECLIGEIDFSSFRTQECSSSTPMCRMTYAYVKQLDNGLISFEYSANHFLHNMIRILTGTLIDIGRGKLEVEDMQRILDAKDRQKAGPTIAPNGLYFMGVDYEHYEVISEC